MIEAWALLKQDNPRLAEAELFGAALALGGGRAENEGSVAPRTIAVRLPDRAAAVRLLGRVSSVRRLALPWGKVSEGTVEARFRAEAVVWGRAAFRPWPGSGHERSRALERAARAFVHGGGTVDLDHPTVRWLFWDDGSNLGRVLQEVRPTPGVPERARRMPNLPFQRPVSLPVRRARAAVNLGAVRPGDAVVDPFAGTGALLLEAGLVGATVSGVDRDAEMIRGAARNLARFPVAVGRLVAADAERAFRPSDRDSWDAIVTDPPYGRSSGTGGEATPALLARCLPAWVPLVRPGGRLVVVAPQEVPLDLPGTSPIDRIPDRVHGSLTREFRVFERTVS